MERKHFANRRFTLAVPRYVKQIFIFAVSLSFIVLLQLLRLHSYQPFFNAFRIEANHQQSNAPPTICEEPLDPPPISDVPPDYPELFKQYARYHHQARQCLESIACSKLQAPDVMIYYNVAIRGGLGDQIRAMMYVLFLAITSNRVFFIDNLNDSISQFQLSAAFVPNFIDWRISPAIRSYISTLSTDSLRYINLELVRGTHYVVSDLEKAVIGKVPKNLKFDVNIADLNITQMVAPYKAAYVFARIRRVHMNTVAPLFFEKRHPSISRTLVDMDHSLLDVQLTQMLFRPSFTVDQMTEERTFPHDQPYVAVHIRTGVDTGESSMGRFDSIRGRSLETVANVWNCIVGVDGIVQNVTRLYIASDDIQLKRDFMEFGHRHNVTVRAVLSPTLHTSTAVSDPNFATDVQCNGFLDAAADIFALARGSSLVAAKSTFADAAFQLGKMENYLNIFLFVVPTDGDQTKQVAKCKDQMLEAHPSLLNTDLSLHADDEDA